MAFRQPLPQTRRQQSSCSGRTLTQAATVATTAPARRLFAGRASEGLAIEPHQHHRSALPGPSNGGLNTAEGLVVILNAAAPPLDVRDVPVAAGLQCRDMTRTVVPAPRLARQRHEDLLPHPRRKETPGDELASDARHADPSRSPCRPAVDECCVSRWPAPATLFGAGRPLRGALLQGRCARRRQWLRNVSSG
jgi:hypothetical protein